MRGSLAQLDWRLTGLSDISTARKLLYTCALLSVVLVLCEGAVRVRSWVKYGGAAASLRDPMIRYDESLALNVPTPGFEVAGKKMHVRINSLGFRGDEFQLKKPAGTMRIAVLGASTTFNMEVSSNHATWPHRLQEKLSSAYPGRRFEVVNAALGGYVAADNLKNLRGRVLPLEPDMVIHYEAHNEIVKDTGELAVAQGLIGQAGRPRWVSRLSSWSLLFDLAYKNTAMLVRARDTTSRKIDRVPRDLPARYIGVLDQMRQELEARQIAFVPSTFIVKYRRNQDRATQVANADVDFYYMPWMSIDGMLDAMDVYNQAILDFARSHDLPVVDDRHAIPPDAEHFTDCMHLADRGADAMAERFFRYLRSSGLLERHTAPALRTTGAQVP